MASAAPNEVLVAQVNLWACSRNCATHEQSTQLLWEKRGLTVKSLHECLILFVLSSAKWYTCTHEGRSTLKLCTFYVALLKTEICSHQPLLDHYFAQKISGFHLRLQANLLLLLTEYHQAWILLFTITGTKMPLSDLCSVLYFNLEADPDLAVLAVYTKDSSEMLTDYVGWGSVPSCSKRGQRQSLGCITT